MQDIKIAITVEDFTHYATGFRSQTCKSFNSFQVKLRVA